MLIKEYYCPKCKYHTPKVSLFKQHLRTDLHNKKSDLDINDIDDFAKYFVKLYKCDICNKNIYSTNQNLLFHKKKCALRNFDPCVLQNKIQQLEKELKIKDKELDNKTYQLKNKDKQLDKALDIAKINSKTANTTVNVLKYAKIHLTDAEPLEKITGDDIYDALKYNNPDGTESKNERYVKTVIHKFKNGIFANFIGDMIIEYYKPKTKADANIITTDTSRLCFIIMQKVKNKDKTEKKEWINDKSGKKFTELVLKPLVMAINEILIEFIAFKKNKEMNEYLLDQLTDCITLKRDISTDKYIKPILKHVAPNFHFDNLKLLDGDCNDTNYSDDNKSIEEKPKKKIKIKIKK